MLELEKIIGENIRLISLASPQQEYNVALIGNFRNNALLVSLPRIADGQSELQVGRRFHIRFKRDNVTYNYHAIVTKICSEPYLCLRLLSAEDWGQEKPTRQARLSVGEKEVKVFFQGADNERISVSMADISISGARLISAVRLGRVNEAFRIHLSIMDGRSKICLPCRIRYVRSEIGSALTEGKMTFHHGVEFIHLTPRVENVLLRLAG